MPLRSTFIYLSRHRGLRRWAETSAIARKLAGRFIAGNTLDEALAACKKIHDDGLFITLDYLGENVRTLEEAASGRDHCLKQLYALKEAGLEPNISVKLTQLGLDFSEPACEVNAEALVEAAAKLGGFVRIDMESTEYTDRTIAMVKRLHGKHPGACGTVMQSYLYRTVKDVKALSMAGIRVRLCKGAYLEKATVAFPNKLDVDRNFLSLTEDLIQFGKYPALATHDEKMIAGVRQFAKNQGTSKEKFEFQMLYGIRRDLQKQLIAEGYRVRIYVPYGEAWFPYFMRRLAERPANLIFILRNMLRS